MAGRSRKHLTEDEHRALQLLAFNPHGATVQALVFGHGFKLQMLDDLVRARLAKRYCVTVRARVSALRGVEVLPNITWEDTGR